MRHTRHVRYSAMDYRVDVYHHKGAVPIGAALARVLAAAATGSVVVLFRYRSSLMEASVRTFRMGTGTAVKLAMARKSVGSSSASSSSDDSGCCFVSWCGAWHYPVVPSNCSSVSILYAITGTARCKSRFHRIPNRCHNRVFLHIGLIGNVEVQS